MLIFMDAEFTDFIDCQLISLALVSEDGQRSLYLEVQDFDRSSCGAFVQSAVWSQLGLIPGAIIKKTEVQNRLRDWFTTLPESVTIASDSQHDRDLLGDALDGEWPVNLTGWFDLCPMLESKDFNQAVAQYHTASRPWHHALFDAEANRAGWLALQRKHVVVSLADDGTFIADLPNGEQLRDGSIGGLAKALHAEGWNADSVQSLDWHVDLDHSLLAGQKIQLKVELRRLNDLVQSIAPSPSR